MKIGCVVYSQTGNTLAVAHQLFEALSASGHTVTMEQLKTQGDAKPGEKVQFTEIPDIGAYDALILGSPVQAFSLATAMEQFLSHVKSLEGKTVALIITQFFPFPWMGGKRALGQLTKLCRSKGAKVQGSRVINWSHPRREANIESAVKDLSMLFSNPPS